MDPQDLVALIRRVLAHRVKTELQGEPFRKVFDGIGKGHLKQSDISALFGIIALSVTSEELRVCHGLMLFAMDAVGKQDPGSSWGGWGQPGKSVKDTGARHSVGSTHRVFEGSNERGGTAPADENAASEGDSEADVTRIGDLSNPVVRHADFLVRVGEYDAVYEAVWHESFVNLCTNCWESYSQPEREEYLRWLKGKFCDRETFPGGEYLPLVWDTCIKVFAELEDQELIKFYLSMNPDHQDRACFFRQLISMRVPKYSVTDQEAWKKLLSIVRILISFRDSRKSYVHLWEFFSVAAEMYISAAASFPANTLFLALDSIPHDYLDKPKVFPPHELGKVVLATVGSDFHPEGGKSTLFLNFSIFEMVWNLVKGRVHTEELNDLYFAFALAYAYSFFRPEDSEGFYSELRQYLSNFDFQVVLGFGNQHIGAKAMFLFVRAYPYGSSQIVHYPHQHVKEAIALTLRKMREKHQQRNFSGLIEAELLRYVRGMSQNTLGDRIAEVISWLARVLGSLSMEVDLHGAIMQGPTGRLFTEMFAKAPDAEARKNVLVTLNEAGDITIAYFCLFGRMPDKNVTHLLQGVNLLPDDEFIEHMNGDTLLPVLAEIYRDASPEVIQKFLKRACSKVGTLEQKIATAVQRHYPLEGGESLYTLLSVGIRGLITQYVQDLGLEWLQKLGEQYVIYTEGVPDFFVWKMALGHGGSTQPSFMSSYKDWHVLKDEFIIELLNRDPKIVLDPEHMSRLVSGCVRSYLRLTEEYNELRKSAALPNKNPEDVERMQRYFSGMMAATQRSEETRVSQLFRKASDFATPSGKAEIEEAINMARYSLGKKTTESPVSLREEIDRKSNDMCTGDGIFLSAYREQALKSIDIGFDSVRLRLTASSLQQREYAMGSLFKSSLCPAALRADRLRSVWETSRRAPCSDIVPVHELVLKCLIHYHSNGGTTREVFNDLSAFMDGYSGVELVNMLLVSPRKPSSQRRSSPAFSIDFIKCIVLKVLGKYKDLDPDSGQSGYTDTVIGALFNAMAQAYQGMNEEEKKFCVTTFADFFSSSLASPAQEALEKFFSTFVTSQPYSSTVGNHLDYVSIALQLFWLCENNGRKIYEMPCFRHPRFLRIAYELLEECSKAKSFDGIDVGELEAGDDGVAQLEKNPERWRNTLMVWGLQNVIHPYVVKSWYSFFIQDPRQVRSELKPSAYQRLCDDLSRYFNWLQNEHKSTFDMLDISLQRTDQHILNFTSAKCSEAVKLAELFLLSVQLYVAVTQHSVDAQELGQCIGIPSCFDTFSNRQFILDMAEKKVAKILEKMEIYDTCYPLPSDRRLNYPKYATPYYSVGGVDSGGSGSDILPPSDFH